MKRLRSRREAKGQSTDLYETIGSEQKEQKSEFERMAEYREKHQTRKKRVSQRATLNDDDLLSTSSDEDNVMDDEIDQL